MELNFLNKSDFLFKKKKERERNVSDEEGNGSQ